MTRRRKKLLRYVGLPITGVLALLIATNILAHSTPGSPVSENRGASPALDRLAEVAARYAPFIYHETERRGGRQDVISNIDFDGDLRGDNNWENFQAFKLKPTVYYAALETETHYFIAYHLFHPRDWNHFTFWLNDTHENDGENLQVVASKSDGRVVLLWTQAHYKSRVYAYAGSTVEPGAVKIRGELQIVEPHVVSSSGATVGASGTHAAVFVESEGHGIYGTLDRDSGVILNGDGSYRFKGGSGLLFRPVRPGEAVEEPARIDTGEAAYQLDCITVKLWPLLRDGKLTGDGRLLDGSYGYSDELVKIAEVPRYYDANRLSGPLGRDRGISPFALDFSFERGRLGALFFNPARRYAESLKISGPWSFGYIDYPFGPDAAVEGDGQ